MKVRSITYFCDPGFPLRTDVMRRAGEFLQLGKAAYEAAGYEVQSLRLATVPFPRILGATRVDALPQAAAQLDQSLEEYGIGHASFGPALPTAPRSYEVIPEAIAGSRNIFFGGIMADARRGIDLRAVRSCADVIVKCAPIDPNGFANLRFAALANVPAGSPFFPAAYHSGTRSAFALATEAADLAVDAFTAANTIEQGRMALVKSVDKHAANLERVAKKLSGRVGAGATRESRRPTAFLGIDFSLAPFPEELRSLGTAMERLGVPRVGMHGSLAAAAILTECIGRARFKRTGFNGLMLPVLEDATLAQRAADGTLTIKDALLYSAVCGTGLDTIPLEGDATAEQIAPVLLDLSALALRLDKPLTARLMPVPGKRAGEATGFDFAFFANSRVMRLEAESLRSGLASAESFSLGPRGST